MSKAYDHVEWSFLRRMLLQMGFALPWVELIMRCNSFVSYTIVINGKEGEELSALMRLARQESLLEGARICRRSLNILHLLFADDCILFAEASKNGVDVLKVF
ncbi:reverse transcriptase [Gossypium australe]|uniref:Reverse transcriptase n=1 Tax=Gossypium australe TaxID=47621 RepID=A0A5B6VY42_9ROSI|nr:reverse transcriptase [Gossypium australe]